MWFSQQTANLVGAIMGSAVGVVGGTCGSLNMIFARKGKYWTFIKTNVTVWISLGVVSLCVGIFALITGQPYHVWYPFALVGFLLVIVIPANYVNAKKIYAAAELKKMSVDELE